MAEIPDYKTLVQNIIWKDDHPTLDLTDDGLKKRKKKRTRNLFILFFILCILLFITFMLGNLLINTGIVSVIMFDLNIGIIFVICFFIVSKITFEYYKDYVEYRSFIIKEQISEKSSDDLSKYPQFHAFTPQYYLFRHYGIMDRDIPYKGQNAYFHPVINDLEVIPLLDLYNISITKQLGEYDISLYFSKDKAIPNYQILIMLGGRKDFVFNFLNSLKNVKLKSTITKDVKNLIGSLKIKDKA